MLVRYNIRMLSANCWSHTHLLSHWDAACIPIYKYTNQTITYTNFTEIGEGPVIDMFVLDYKRPLFVRMSSLSVVLLLLSSLLLAQSSFPIIYCCLYKRSDKSTWYFIPSRHFMWVIIYYQYTLYNGNI